MAAKTGFGKAPPFWPSRRGRSSSAASAGLSVSELNAEITVETAIVSANCRKNCPTIPRDERARHEHAP